MARTIDVTDMGQDAFEALLQTRSADPVDVSHLSATGRRELSDAMGWEPNEAWIQGERYFETREYQHAVRIHRERELSEY